MSQFIFPPLTASLDSEAVSGAALPVKQMITGGYHAGGSKVYPIAVDADGQLQVDVVSSMPLPTGAATEAKQDTMITDLTNIETYTNTIQGAVSGTEMQVDVVAALPTGSNAIGKLAANSGVDIGDVDVTSSALPTGAATSALQTTANGILTTIDADTGTLAGAVSGTEMQVDVVASLPAGSNNIGDVDVLSSALPTGAATSALQTTANGILTTIDTDTGSLAGCVTGTELQVDIVASLPAGSNNIGDVDVLSLPADSKNYVWKEGLDSTISGITNTILDTSALNIPSGTQLTVATLTNDIYEIQTVEDIGEFIGIYAGSDLKAILPLGGGTVKINLPDTTVVKLASFSGTAISSGKIAINFLG